MDKSSIYSIGHGNKKVEDFIEELTTFNIKFLIDIRSKPYSKFNNRFNRSDIEKTLLAKDIKYIYMGDSLGGLPDDLSCYTDGHVDYEKLKEKDFFKKGLKRLITAYHKKINIAIMCSEGKPEECHRTKLIGEELRKMDISLNHIVRTKDSQKKVIIKSQKEVMLLVAPNGISNLFGEKVYLTSRKKYNNPIS